MEEAAILYQDRILKSICRKKEGDYMAKCPLTREDCTVDCAWFKNGECCIASLPDLVDKLEDMVTSIEALEQTVKNKDFSA